VSRQARQPDSAWEQRKLEARKMLENGDESPASSARFVGRFFVIKDSTFYSLSRFEYFDFLLANLTKAIVSYSP